MPSWSNAISTLLLTAMAVGGPASYAAPGGPAKPRDAGKKSPEPRVRVKAPPLQESRLPPLTGPDRGQAPQLTPEEEEVPLIRALAHRFNPAMAFPTRDIW